MFSTLRNRFGIPGVISVIALVFAMFGGAYAASNTSSGGGSKATTSAKAKKGPRGPKGATGPAGPAGPAGPVGPAGAAGPKGDAGAVGAPGKDGTNGKEGKQGKEGSPWTAGGTLPSGSTETGMWSMEGRALGEPPFTPLQRVPLSFTVPLATPLQEANVHYIQAENEDLANCPGNVKDPLAKAGQLCVYSQSSTNLEALVPVTFSKGGVVMFAVPTVPSETFGSYGSWAVTAG
jgi:hypothetical protein